MGIFSPGHGTRQNSAICSAMVRSRVIQAGGGCYLSRILFANWVRQESEMFKLFYQKKFPTAKSEFQTRFETHSIYSHNPPEATVIVKK